jgi:membrane-bound lytic murein transglycosylase D
VRKIQILALFLVFIFISDAYSQDFPFDSASLDFIWSQPREELDHFPNEINYETIESRIGTIHTEIPINYNDKVYAFIKYFTEKDREYTRMVLKRSTYYFPIFEEVLRKHNLPQEIKYLSIIESGLNPRAISRVGAAGLWQFMPLTGRYYKLHQDWYVDERMDPYKATEAACLYLKQMYDMFGDWELALAAYNTGPGNVRKAMRRSGKKSFWDIYRYLPRETRSYVPQWAAMVYTMNFAEDHNFFVEDEFEYEIDYDTIMVKQFLNIEILANHLDLCLEDLQKLNPSLKRNALPENTNLYPVKIPTDKLNYFIANRVVILDSSSYGKKHFEQLARNTPGSTYGRDKIVYRVKSGDVLGTIAMRYGIGISDLRRWNNISGNLIRVGQRLDIWMLPGAFEKQPNIVNSKPETVTPQILDYAGSKVYLVQSGDTLWDISKKFDGLTIEKIKELNNLTSNKITPGQKLIIQKNSDD